MDDTISITDTDDTTPIIPTETPSPIAEMTALRDALQDQLSAYHDLLGQFKSLMTTPTPPPTAIGNPAQSPILNVDEVRQMDVQTIKRRLDEVLGTLKGRI